MVKRKAAPATPARELDRFTGDPDFMLSLGRGLLVLRAFEIEPRLTASRVAKLTGLPRPTARRCLYTLEQLGYLAAEDGAWIPQPRLLALAQSYLTSTGFLEAVRRHLELLRDEVHESCSLGVLDGGDVVYVARAETKRIISIGLHVGSRLPAYCTSMGRVLLADLGDDEQLSHLRAGPFPARTRFTRTTATALRRELKHVAAAGYALVDQELEIGLRSIAVPVLGSSGRAVAALNVGVPNSYECSALVTDILPHLRTSAEKLREIATLPL